MTRDPEGVATRAPSAPPPGAGESGGPEAEHGTDNDEAWSAAFEQLREIGRDQADYEDVSLERARLGVHAGAFRLVAVAWMALAAAAATIVAVYFLIEGLAGGFAALFGAPWAGRLAGGLAALLALAAVTLLVRARARRSNLERLKRKYEQRRRARSGKGVAS